MKRGEITMMVMGSGLPQNESEAAGSNVAFIPDNVDQLLESDQSGMRVKDSRKSG